MKTLRALFIFIILLNVAYADDASPIDVLNVKLPKTDEPKNNLNINVDDLFSDKKTSTPVEQSLPHTPLPPSNPTPSEPVKTFDKPIEQKNDNKITPNLLPTLVPNNQSKDSKDNIMPVMPEIKKEKTGNEELDIKLPQINDKPKDSTTIIFPSQKNNLPNNKITSPIPKVEVKEEIKNNPDDSSIEANLPTIGNGGKQDNLKFDGLLNTKQNKSNKEDPYNKYSVSIPSDKLWDNTIMFTNNEIIDLRAALDDFLYGYSSIKNPSESKVTEKGSKKNVVIKVGSIVYFSEENWSIWVNRIKITSKDKNRSFPGFKVIDVQPDNVTLNIRITNETEIPTDKNKEQNKKIFGTDVIYNKGDDFVTVKLGLNQVFNSRTMKVTEGGL